MVKKKKFFIISVCSLIVLLVAMFLFLQVFNNGKVPDIFIRKDALLIESKDGFIDDPTYFVENADANTKLYTMYPEKIDLSTKGEQNVEITYKGVVVGFTITIE